MGVFGQSDNFVYIINVKKEREQKSQGSISEGLNVRNGLKKLH